MDESSFLSFFGECEKESSVEMVLRLTRRESGTWLQSSVLCRSRPMATRQTSPPKRRSSCTRQ